MVSTVNGDANVPFYKELGNQGISDRYPGGGGVSVGKEDSPVSTPSPLVAVSRS